jgi:AraC-like DNA-binding protein
MEPPQDLPPSEVLVEGSPHLWASLRPELMWVYQAEIPEGKGDSQDHRDRQVSAWLIMEGWGAAEVDGTRHIAHANEWLICHARELRQQFSPGAKVLSVRCHLGWPGGEPLFAGGGVATFSAKDGFLLERKTRRLLSRFGHIDWDSPAAFLYRRTLSFPDYVRHESELLAWVEALFTVMAKVGRPVVIPKSMDYRLAVACQMLDALRPGDAFPKHEIIRATGLSLGHLNRLCHEEHGFSLSAYRDHRKLLQAKIGLEDPARTVKELSVELGFLQLSHFSSWFKKRTGFSPRAFRTKVLGDVGKKNW